MNRRNRAQSSDEEGALVLHDPKVINIPDLVNLIADYCDDESLSKLSRVCMKEYQDYRLIAMCGR